MAIIGSAAWFAGAHTVGLTLVCAGVGSMFAAAAVLFTSSTSHRVAAFKQESVPALSLVLLLISLI